MKPIIFVSILLTLALAACLPAGTSISLPSAVPSATNPTPTSTTPAPAAAATNTPSATAAPTQKDFPTPTVLPGATQAIPTPTPSAGVLATQTAPDCAAFPGFPSCGASLPLSGKLALLDAASQWITVLDFDGQQTWKVKAAPQAQRLVWLGGNFLLTYNNQDQPSLVWADPAYPGSFHLPLPGAPGEGTPVFTAADGSTAWMEMRGTQFTFHIRLDNASQEQIWPAAGSGDQIHKILGWVPGTSLLLAGYHFSGNSMWVTGDRLYTLDPASGTIQEMPGSLRLGASFAWHPTQPGLLAFGDSNQSPMNGAPRLAALDVLTGSVTHLIADEFVISSYPSWTPDGKAILHAASKAGSPAAAGDPFALPAVYLTQWPGGTTHRLTGPPAGSRDDWPQLLPDGDHFLYLRVPDSGQPVELRLGTLDGSLDALVGSGLGSAPPQPFPPHWESVLAYTP